MSMPAGPTRTGSNPSTDRDRIRRMMASATRLTDEDCLEDAEDVLREALSLARSTGAVDLASEVKSDLAGLHKRRGEFDEALALIREVRGEAERGSMDILVEASLANEATLLWEMSHSAGDQTRLKEAWELANRAVTMCQEHDWDGRLAFVLGTRALIERFLDRWEDAGKTFDRQLKVARGCQDADLLGRALLNSISFNVERQDYLRATELAREARTIVDGIREVTLRAQIAGVLRQIGMLS